MPDEFQTDDSPESTSRSTWGAISLEPCSATSALTEDLALAQLKDRGLSSDIVEQISGNVPLMKSRKVRVALASHPHAPRRIALRLIRELYTFDLMRFSLLPAVAADLKRVAEELLVSRLASISLGERISLARRSSALVAGATLLDGESRVWRTALENPRLSESAIVKALLRPNTGAPFVETVSHHAKWSLRQEIRMALLRSAHTPLARVLDFARHLPPSQLRDVLRASRLPEKIKAYLRRHVQLRSQSSLKRQANRSQTRGPKPEV